MKKFKVPVTRISYGFNTIVVQAETEEEALSHANEICGDLEYSEKLSDYEFPDGAIEISNL